jgi:hypothetical protein
VAHMDYVCQVSDQAGRVAATCVGIQSASSQPQMCSWVACMSLTCRLHAGGHGFSKQGMACFTAAGSWNFGRWGSCRCS